MLIYLNLIETEEDKRKFERIYLAYKQTMFYAANRILKNHYASEDAVHQAFLKIIDHLDKINEDNCQKTRAFLVVVVENISIDIYRKQKRENMVLFDELELYIADDTSQEVVAIDEVSSAILKLPVNYSTVLRLKFSQGYNDAEIAEILNITQDNVRQRISRAKKKLSEVLKKEGEYIG